MITQNKQDFIVKNSSGDTYFFYLDNNKVKYEKYFDKQALFDTNMIPEDKVIDFSVDIDKNDRIHLLCLTSEGNLKYYLYSNEKWLISIVAKFDIKSNHYSSFSLRINNDNLHILYAYSNLINSTVWTIQHIMLSKNKWDKMNVISITSGKSAPYFIIDFDKFDNIHMVYKAKVDGKENIYYTSFNLPLKKWTQLPQQISDLKNNNICPYLFIDSKDNMHIVWCSSSNDKYQLAYKHLSSLGNNKFRWKTENLPVNIDNICNPIIYEEKGIIKIMLNSYNAIKTIYSNDNGFTWKLVNAEQIILIDNLEIARYSSNYQIEKNKYKINDLYLNVESSFIQLPDKFFNRNKNTNINTEEHDSNNTYTEQLEKIEQSPKDEPVSVLENVDEFEDELVQEFLSSTKNSIDTVFSNENKIEVLKSQVEKIIFDNCICLDEKISYYNDSSEKVISRLENLEKILEQCKNENNALLTLIDSMKEMSMNRENSILLIESKINQMKETLSTESNQSIFKKMLNVFKKDI